MKKEFLIIFLIVLTISLCACSSKTEKSNDNNVQKKEINNVERKVSSEDDFIAEDTINGYMIVEYIGDAQIINIPETINGKVVEGIARGAFVSVKIEELNLSSGIKRIENDAFLLQKNLKKVTFNEGLVYIGDSAFSLCESLEEIVLPSTLEELSTFAFGSCKSLEKVNLPEKLTKLGDTVFGGTAIKTITIPQNIKKIPAHFLSLCKNLTDVYILNNEAEINLLAFEESPNVIIHAKPGSSAEKFAKENEMRFLEN